MKFEQLTPVLTGPTHPIPTLQYRTTRDVKSRTLSSGGFANRIMSTLLFCALTAVSARATVIYSSLGETTGGFNYAVENINDDNTDEGNEFFTPSGPSLTLNDVIAVLEGTAGAGAVTAYVYSNLSGVPGTQLTAIATLAQSSIPSSFGDVTFTATSTITLLASTEYWIVLSGADDSVVDARWEEGNVETGTGVTGQSHAAFNGSAWVAEPNNTNTNGIPLLEVDATANSSVPEPGTFGMIGASLAALATIGRRLGR
jgi:hypothetical protein